MKKSKTRLYFDKKLSPNIMIYIKEKQHHFLKNVLRIKVKDLITVFDGVTGEWLSEVISINRDNTVLQIKKKISEIEKETDLWLIFSPIKLFRMNITIQKATELGVSQFIPCITQNTNLTKINMRNLYMNIVEAAEQSERLTLPKLNEVVNLNNLLRDFPKDRGLIFCNENDKNLPSIFKALENKSSIFKKWAILIGPEGGFSETETKEILSISSSIPVSLGKRILRSDTATTAALFAVQSFIEK
jgi:16S rRNA (uracil1498-N3)-methyltransferase